MLRTGDEAKLGADIQMEDRETRPDFETPWSFFSPFSSHLPGLLLPSVPKGKVYKMCLCLVSLFS